ncbi:MAG: AbrB/MazE/SpoVT family DNA-binding domain-containing protein [Comamonadaceae bacterium]|nr:MAG: AbrB/MazE/SpoVT family DNA-binding domain-containing protein [Comamonadaceae bacterium]
MKTNIVTVSPKYQVVIPQAVRDHHGIRPGAKMAVLDFGNMIRLVPIRAPADYIGIAAGLTDTNIVDDPERF